MIYLWRILVVVTIPVWIAPAAILLMLADPIMATVRYVKTGRPEHLDGAGT